MSTRDERIDRAKHYIHSRQKSEREAARAVLLELAAPQLTIGERGVDVILGEVEVDAVWPIASGARGWPYVVHRVEDDWPYATYVAGELAPVSADV